jgi:hypothetical protein
MRAMLAAVGHNLSVEEHKRRRSFRCFRAPLSYPCPASRTPLRIRAPVPVVAHTLLAAVGHGGVGLWGGGSTYDAVYWPLNVVGGEHEHVIAGNQNGAKAQPATSARASSSFILATIVALGSSVLRIQARSRGDENAYFADAKRGRLVVARSCHSTEDPWVVSLLDFRELSGGCRLSAIALYLSCSADLLRMEPLFFREGHVELACAGQAKGKLPTGCTETRDKSIAGLTAENVPEGTNTIQNRWNGIRTRAPCWEDGFKPPALDQARPSTSSIKSLRKVDSNPSSPMRKWF